MLQSIAELQKALSKNTQSVGSSKYYPFHTITEEQQARVRFLPDVDADNPRGFLVQRVTHNLTINGQFKSTPCLSMYDMECPICEASRKFYKDEGEDSINGPKYWKKREFVGQVLVIKDPLEKDSETGENFEGKVMPIVLRTQIYNALKTGIEKGGLEELPYLFEGGCDFLINKTMVGEYPNYTSSMFARKATDLDEEIQAYIEENLVSLSSFIPNNPGLEVTQGLLASALGEVVLDDEEADDEEADDDDVIVVSKSKSKSKSTVEVDEDVKEDEDEEDTEVDNVLATIRNRRAKKEA